MSLTKMTWSLQVHFSLTMATSGSNPPHALFFPWLGYGHITPHIELAKRLSSHGIKVSFLSTPSNIKTLKSCFPDIESLIQLIDMKLPVIEGLEGGMENTSHLKSPEHMRLLKRAVDSMETPLEKLLDKFSPDIVFFDMFSHWLPKIASKRHPPIQTILFVPMGAMTHAYLFRKTAGPIEEYYKPPQGFPSSAIRWKPFEASYGFSSKNPSEVERIAIAVQDCSAIIVKSAPQLEGKFIDYFSVEMNKGVHPVGSLLPTDYGMRESSLSSRNTCMSWLDKQDESSVLYVALGSEAFVPGAVSTALALGLEQSNVPFLWGAREDVELPQGFTERIQGRGLVVVGEWLPQREILKHRGVGGFLSHCGWSSVMESLSCGVAMVCLVVGAEGGLNCRLIVEELGVGVEVHRGEDGSLDGDSVCNAVRALMVDGGGVEIRNKAKEIGEVFHNEILNPGGLQEQYIHDLVVLIQRLSSHEGDLAQA